MSRYIATFHTHLSALLTCQRLTAAGVRARMMPVPRKLSASCGTCVDDEAAEPLLEQMDTDVERVFAVEGEICTLLLETDCKEVTASAVTSFHSRPSGRGVYFLFLRARRAMSPTPSRMTLG